LSESAQIAQFSCFFGETPAFRCFAADSFSDLENNAPVDDSRKPVG
jgi:hypothetical protein